MTKIKEILFKIGRKQRGRELWIILALAAIAILSVIHPFIILKAILLILVEIALIIFLMSWAVTGYSLEVIKANKLRYFLLGDFVIEINIWFLVFKYLRGLLPVMQWYWTALIYIVVILLTIVLACFVGSYFQNKIIDPRNKN